MVLKILNKIENIECELSVALGFFDGLHRGHMPVIKNAVDGACGTVPAVFTFSRSPKGSELLITDSYKHELLEAAGIRIVIRPDFKDVRGLGCEEFVRNVIKEKLKAKRVCCGYDYRFGRAAVGDAELLRALCLKYGVECEIISAETDSGEKVSSSRIRRLVKEGDVAEAARLLGHPFTYDMPVVHGKKIGRTLGAPTINQHFPDDFCIPRYGVYASLAELRGNLFYGVTNIGIKPTVGAEHPLSETWIPDICEDLYGESIRISLICFMRKEIKFESVEILKKKIYEDAVEAKQIAENYMNSIHKKI